MPSAYGLFVGILTEMTGSTEKHNYVHATLYV